MSTIPSFPRPRTIAEYHAQQAAIREAYKAIPTQKYTITKDGVRFAEMEVPADGRNCFYGGEALWTEKDGFRKGSFIINGFTITAV